MRFPFDDSPEHRGLITRPEERGDFDKMAIECITEARWKPGENDAKGNKNYEQEKSEKHIGQDEFLEQKIDETPGMLKVFAFVLLFFC